MSDKKKVAFFAEILIRDFDGASRTMFNVIDRIPREDFDFMFFCAEPPDEAFDYPLFRFPAMRIPFNETYKMAVPYFKKKELFKTLDEFKPDVIHIASPSPMGSVAQDYAKKRGVKLVGIYHTHFISYVEYYLKRVPGMSALQSPAQRFVVNNQKKFYDKMDVIFTPTKQMIKELGGFGLRTDNMVLWQRGLNHTIFNPSKRDETALREITGNDRPCVIFASRLVWEKNLETLAQVASLAGEQGLDYNFIIAGDGVAKSKLEGMMPNAYFLGNVPHEKLAMLYATCDAFVFPSITETYGNVVVEAMASGCPCVIAQGGGSQSHVEQDVNGLLSSPNDAAQYVDHLKRIIENPDIAQRYRQEGYKYTSDLDWDKLCRKYFSKLEEVIDTCADEK